MYWTLDLESLRKSVDIQWRNPLENYRNESGLIQSLVGQVSPCASVLSLHVQDGLMTQ